jgi:DNA modification methylase
LAELAGWDEEILAIELQGLLSMELDFEITDIGFEMAEIDILIAESTVPAAERVAEPDLEPGCLPPVAKPGDLWQLGSHLLFCGDALDHHSYEVLLGREKAAMIFTDPPYNVPIQGHVSGLGKARHREFLQASGEMSQAEFNAFLQRMCALMHERSQSGSLHFICMDWRHIADLIGVGSTIYSELKNLCVWVKPNGGMGTLYRSRHELVAVFKAGQGKHSNNVQLGAHGRYRTNVWEYDGMSSFQRDRDRNLAMHPTVKPVGMIADAILDCSNRGGLILDPFAGSGSTILAAERTGRVCRAIELDPAYVDVALARYQRSSGKTPINLWTGRSYEAPCEGHLPSTQRGAPPNTNGKAA